MIIGIPREVMTDEYRISLQPDKVDLLVKSGHKVLVGKGAGAGSGRSDKDYKAIGASISTDPAEVYGADMVVKVKQPLPQEYPYFRKGLVIFSYLHLSPEPELTQALLDAGITGIAFETVQEPDGSLPLLYPMSEIAGLLAPQIAAWLLQATNGGPGKLLSGVPGTAPCNVIVVGGGTVGLSAGMLASRWGANVTILDTRIDRLRYIDSLSHHTITTLVSSPMTLNSILDTADVVIGAVLVTGAKAPRVITSDMLKRMPKKSIIIDVAIDQGGCVEGIHPTTHHNPTYSVDGVTIYAVRNMPGIVPNTASISLSNAIFPYVLRLANNGLRQTIIKDRAIVCGINLHNGHIIYPAVAEALGRKCVPVEEALAG